MKTIITAAITGAVPTTAMNRAVPVTIPDQIASAKDCFDAGASIIHLHLRDEHERPYSNTSAWIDLVEGVRAACPGVLVNTSTGGRGLSDHERQLSFPAKPDMATLATGSSNYPDAVNSNPPALISDMAIGMFHHKIMPEIEVFDTAMLYNTACMIRSGKLPSKVHVNFVMGVENSMPVNESLLDFLVREVEKEIPHCTWGATGVSKHSFKVMRWAIARAGHIRTGMEDTLRLENGHVALNNAALIEAAAYICMDYGNEIATPEETRDILSCYRVREIAQ